MTARIGIDVGGTTTDVVLVDGPNNGTKDGRDDGPPVVPRILARSSIPTPTTGERALVAAIVAAVNTVRCIAGVSDAATVGLGMPGIVDAERGTVTDAVNLGLSGRTVAVATMVGRALGLPTCLDNDVRAASLEALRLERQRDPQVAHLLLLNLGTGVAAAIVQDGVLLRGPLGDAGEIGHVPIPGRNEPCRCGRNGCLETLVSGPALARRWPRDDPHLLMAGTVGEPSLQRAMSEIATDVAFVVRWLRAVTGIGRVVLGGGVGTSGPGLLDAVRTALVDPPGAGLRAGLPSPSSWLGALPRDHPTGALGAAALPTSGLPFHGGPHSHSSTEGS